MKIAITADLHLTNRRDHPERYHALENILEQMRRDGMNFIILAGDVFDEYNHNYTEFESLCKDARFREITFHIIPGNHDVRLSNAMVAADNVMVHSQPRLLNPDPAGLTFLLLPYQKDKTMGDIIARFAEQLIPNEWLLIGHGDWVESMFETNPLETGVYMPLTRSDILIYRPARVVLGHIHKTIDAENVHYPGSPCPLDITETGRRRFLIIDTESGAVKPQTVESDFIFFDESFVILPLKNERTYLEKEIVSRIKPLGLTEIEIPKVKIRVQVKGCTSNKRELMQTLRECFRGFTFYPHGEPDISEVFLSDDVDRAEIAQRTANTIKEFNWPQNQPEPAEDQIFLEALRVIYGD